MCIIVVALLRSQKLIPRIYWHMPALHGASHFYRLRAGCYVEDHMTCEASGITHESLLEIIPCCRWKGEFPPEVSLLFNSTPPPKFDEVCVNSRHSGPRRVWNVGSGAHLLPPLWGNPLDPVDWLKNSKSRILCVLSVKAALDPPPEPPQSAA